MTKSLMFSEFKQLAEKGKRVAIYRELVDDALTPMRLIESLQAIYPQIAVLESGSHQDQSGSRFSFIAFDVIARFKKMADKQNHFAELRSLMQEVGCVAPEEMTHYLGGIGFLSYHASRSFEKLPNRHGAPAFPEILFNFYRSTIIYDHQTKKITLTFIVDLTGDLKVDYATGELALDHIIKVISAEKQRTESPSSASFDGHIKTDLEDHVFQTLVVKAKEYIKEGEAFQIVLSRSFKLAYTVSPMDIYRALKKISPAPYMFYLPLENETILGASPEKLISVLDKQVEMHPIAGTIKKTNHSDLAQLETQLLNDVKERAEHTMLVDLARNDLGVVCQPGSVKVEKLMQVKHLSHVSHITSNVTGLLSDHKDAFDALASAFPAGTLTGAPKIRAMEIIDELETSERNLYGGAICRIDYAGNLDSCIAIRMIHLQDGIATVRAGAGIVADSDPAKEANETLQKASGMLDAIRYAHEGSL